MNDPLVVTPIKPTGEAIAAFMSAMFGLLSLSIAEFVQESNIDYYNAVYQRIGSWMPRASEIGPYSGKETILIVTWLGSWLILHLLLRKRNPRVAPWAIAFVIGMAMATILLWPPFGMAVIPE